MQLVCPLLLCCDSFIDFSHSRLHCNRLRSHHYYYYCFCCCLCFKIIEQGLVRLSSQVQTALPRRRQLKEQLGVVLAPLFKAYPAHFAALLTLWCAKPAACFGTGVRCNRCKADAALFRQSFQTTSLAPPLLVSLLMDASHRLCSSQHWPSSTS